MVCAFFTPYLASFQLNGIARMLLGAAKLPTKPMTYWDMARNAAIDLITLAHAHITLTERPIR